MYIRLVITKHCFSNVSVDPSRFCSELKINDIDSWFESQRDHKKLKPLNRKIEGFFVLGEVHVPLSLNYFN